MRKMSKGGIQPGTTASSSASRKLDYDVNQISHHLIRFYGQKYRLTRIDKVPRSMISGECNVGCKPDGGVIVKDHGAASETLLCAFEAKTQGAKGNAIERWWENFIILERLNCTRYVLFGSGAGTNIGGPIYERWNMKLSMDGRKNEFNTVHNAGVSFFINPAGIPISTIRHAMITAMDITEDVDEKNAFASMFDDPNVE